MGWIGKTGSFVGRQFMLIAGVEQMKLGAGMVSRQWRRVATPLCPACNQGRLHPFTETIKGEKVKFRGCSQCSHYQAVELEKDQDSLDRLQTIAHLKAADMTPAEHRELMRRFQLSSRWLYSFSLLVVLVSLYLLYTGYDAWTFMNAIVIAVFLFVRGLIASYRSWQAKERRWFVPGSFKYWLGLGKWLI